MHTPEQISELVKYLNYLLDKQGNYLKRYAVDNSPNHIRCTDNGKQYLIGSVTAFTRIRPAEELRLEIVELDKKKQKLIERLVKYEN